MAGDVLGPGILRRVAALFPAEQRAEAGTLLVECGRALTPAEPAGIERVQLAVLKISGGSIDRLRDAVETAGQDWRDALVGAGFGDDVRAHLAWLAEPDTGP